MNPDLTCPERFSFYQSFTGVQNKDRRELCSFYLIAYIKQFTDNPEMMLKAVREEGSFMEASDSLDKVLPQRFLGLLEDRWKATDDQHIVKRIMQQEIEMS